MIALAVVSFISIAMGVGSDEIELERVSLHGDYGFGLQLCAPKSLQVTSSSLETHKASLKKKTKKVQGYCQIQCVR